MSNEALLKLVEYSSSDGAKITDISSLKDDVNYRYYCRCGCGAWFAGYGYDLKASSSVGPNVYISESESVDTLSKEDGQSSQKTDEDDNTVNIHKTILEDTAIIDSRKVFQEDKQNEQNSAHSSNSRRPFVPDRFLKKALWGLSDDEIDSEANKTSTQITNRLSDRDPPAVGDLVVSVSTGDGPYTLLDYAHREIQVDHESKHRVYCGIIRSSSGRCSSVPLADLIVCKELPQRRSKWLDRIITILSAILLCGLIYFALRL